MYIYIHTRVQCPQRPDEGNRSPGTAGSCEVTAWCERWNQIQVSWKDSECSYIEASLQPLPCSHSYQTRGSLSPRGEHLMPHSSVIGAHLMHFRTLRSIHGLYPYQMLDNWTSVQIFPNVLWEDISCPADHLHLCNYTLWAAWLPFRWFEKLSGILEQNKLLSSPLPDILM